MAVQGTRTIPRLKRSLSVRLEDGWVGEVVDLSATGLRITSHAMLEAGARFVGELVLEDGRTMAIDGDVVWSRRSESVGFLPSEIGVELARPTPAYLALVAELFAE